MLLKLKNIIQSWCYSPFESVVVVSANGLKHLLDDELSGPHAIGGLVLNSV